MLAALIECSVSKRGGPIIGVLVACHVFVSICLARMSPAVNGGHCSLFWCSTARCICVVGGDANDNARENDLDRALTSFSMSGAQVVCNVCVYLLRHSL